MIARWFREASLCGFLATTLLLSSAGAAEFPLREGDTWVMVGDSITAQHLHSNYIEAFCYARYPKLTFRFRNSGVGGDTIPKVLARYDWDVAPWKPTVVSVELGMNDKGSFTVEQFIANMGTLNDKITAGNARPVYLSASPVNNGETMAKLSGNARLDQYAKALRPFAAEKNAPYADQFHALVDIWGKNKPRENIANLISSAQTVARENELKGEEHLNAFLAEQAKDPEPPVTLQGDPVHPGPIGQLTMASALLQELGANPFVSSAKLDASGKVIESKGCTIDNVQSASGKLAFDRLDETLPFPIPAEARPALRVYPQLLDMSQYTLQVTGLESGKYRVAVNGKPIGTTTAAELEKGVNLTAFADGPIDDHGQSILELVKAKEGIVSTWRGVSRLIASGTVGADAKAQLEKLEAAVVEADAKIRTAAQPRKLRFELQLAE